MITVLTYFYYPVLGTVRGIVIDGTPMISCNETAELLGFYNADGFKEMFCKNYNAKYITVPVSVDTHGIAKTETLLFINEEAVYRLIELSAVRAWEKYTAWFSDFVFPMLRQIGGTSVVTEDAQRFYLECTEPKSEKTKA